MKLLPKLGLPDDYSIELALAIRAYTMEVCAGHPSMHRRLIGPSLQEPPHDPLYAAVNRAMFDPSRRKQTTDGTNEVSSELRAALPFIKLLDAALERLPDSFRYRGRCHRGVKWVFPSPDGARPHG